MLAGVLACLLHLLKDLGESDSCLGEVMKGEKKAWVSLQNCFGK
jgi:hypothetical protein